VLTGEPGTGKSTCCRQVVRAAREAGLVVRGVVAHDEPTGGGTRRRLEDLRSGERFLLARTAPPEATAAGAPRWTLDEAALDRCDAILAQACPADLLVIDEVGPVELVQRRGTLAGVRRALSGPYGVALVVVRPWLVARFGGQFPSPSPEVVDVREAGVLGRLLATVVVREPV
jgi:nucleoside-triphosphatase THEP1